MTSTSGKKIGWAVDGLALAIETDDEDRTVGGRQRNAARLPDPNRAQATEAVAPLGIAPDLDPPKLLGRFLQGAEVAVAEDAARLFQRPDVAASSTVPGASAFPRSATVRVWVAVDGLPAAGRGDQQCQTCP